MKPTARKKQAATHWPAVATKITLAAAAWTGAYWINGWLWDWVLGDLAGLDLNSHLGGALHFFAYDTIKILLLLTGLMFAIGLARASFDTNRTRAYLEGKPLLVGLVLAVILGIVTPFCSCSSIPLFIGFVAAGIPLPITLTFLAASPLVSETAAIMIGAQFGWGLAITYVVAGSLLSLAIGWFFSLFPLEKWVEPSVFQIPAIQAASSGSPLDARQRLASAVAEAREIFSKVWLWVIAGVGVGAAIHGWVPADFFLTYAGADNPLAVPLATILGVPLYVNGGGIVPIGEALWSKGMPVGTVMSLMMGAIALSIPEGIMLRRVLKPQLLALFFGAVTVGIIAVGYLLNIFYAQ